MSATADLVEPSIVAASLSHSFTIESEVWVQAMVYCGASVSRETTFSNAEMPTPETRAAGKTLGSSALPAVSSASKNGKLEKLCA